jgi:hypothetical protein
MCEGSGSYIDHYDGDFTPGREEDKNSIFKETKRVVTNPPARRGHKWIPCSCRENRTLSTV